VNNPHDDLSDMLGAYVLDALSPEEQATFEEHLQECAACRAEVAELQQVVDILPLAVEPVPPPAALRDRIFAALEAEGVAQPDLQAMPGGAPARSRRPAVRSMLRVREVWFAAAAAVIILGLVAWNVALQTASNQQSAYQRDVVAALASGARVTPMSGTKSAPGASASLVQPHRGAPYLIVEGLPTLPANHLFAVWFLHGSSPDPAGVFNYSGSGAQIVHLPVSSLGYSVSAVTDEARPSGRQPKGPIVLLGKIA
jgi:hypothetical protein